MLNNYQKLKTAVLATLKQSIKSPSASIIEPYAEDRLISWFVNYPSKVRPATQRAMETSLGDVGSIVVKEASNQSGIGCIVRFTITLPKDMTFEEADEMENEMDAIAMTRRR